MSKNVKYISSDHFGAPVIKGDRWGYLVEMLRKALVEGFNERTDLTNIEVLDSETIRASFNSAHNYVVNQTIKISGVPFTELNDDFRVEKVNGNIVTCKAYQQNLTGIVGQTQVGTFKAIVSPCGLIEKFKDGNRSVFTTDEQEAFLYIDDRDGGTRWKHATNGQTAIITPIVYMTDKMTDINTDAGKYIVPFDSANPTNHKRVDYTPTGVTNGIGMGIWNWTSFGAWSNVSSLQVNTPAQQQNIVKWEVIGNGRYFYLLISLVGGSQLQIRKHIFAFGKFKPSNKNYVDLPYILSAQPPDANTGMFYAYSYRRCATAATVQPWNNIMHNTSTNYPWPTIDLGLVGRAVLAANKKSTTFYTLPAAIRLAGAQINWAPMFSGLNGSYPDNITKKYNIDRINIYTDTNDLLGTLPGLMWSYNSSNVYNADGLIMNYKFKNKTKKLYTYNNSMSNTSNGDPTQSGAPFVYNISLEYEDWLNYE